MNLSDKIKRSWWVLLSFIFFLNGLGFLYIGFKHNNRNWVIEGIAYEIPWFFYFIVYAIYGFAYPAKIIATFATVLMLICVIRSIWVAIKLVDVYENNEKYTIRQTNLNNSHSNQNNENSSSKFSCCICILCIFFILAVIAIL